MGTLTTGLKKQRSEAAQERKGGSQEEEFVVTEIPGNNFPYIRPSPGRLTTTAQITKWPHT